MRIHTLRTQKTYWDGRKGSSTERALTDLEKRQQIQNRRDFDVGCHWTAWRDGAVRRDTQSSIVRCLPFSLTCRYKILKSTS